MAKRLLILETVYQRREIILRVIVVGRDEAGASRMYAYKSATTAKKCGVNNRLSMIEIRSTRDDRGEALTRFRHEYFELALIFFSGVKKRVAKNIKIHNY